MPIIRIVNTAKSVHGSEKNNL